MEIQRESGPGYLLKTEREKKGLSLKDMAEVTRLRLHFLEAMENEEWDKLPGYGLTKGFIRSYAQSLGIDANEVIRLFDNAVPRPKFIPKPLAGTEKKQNKGKYFLYAAAIIILVALILFGLGKRLFEDGVSLPDKVQEEQAIPSSTQEREKAAEDKVEVPLPPEIELRDFEPEIMYEEMKIAKDLMPALIEEYEEITQDSNETAVLNEKKYSLTAIVSMETYIRIYVDDIPPREYIFKPGSRPSWTADKGFDVIVGNAAGIDFDFNGRKITDLGGEGRVRRLNLPEDFRSDHNEN